MADTWIIVSRKAELTWELPGWDITIGLPSSDVCRIPMCNGISAEQTSTVIILFQRANDSQPTSTTYQQWQCYTEKATRYSYLMKKVMCYSYKLLLKNKSLQLRLHFKSNTLLFSYFWHFNVTAGLKIILKFKKNHRSLRSAKVHNVICSKETIFKSIHVYVSNFKYLRHVIIDNSSDNGDIRLEIRCMFTQCNMLRRRFYNCSMSVKLVLFKSFCLCLC